MNLVIDVGNSFIKTAVFQGGELLLKESSPKKDFHEKLKKLLVQYPEIAKAIISNVSDELFLDDILGDLPVLKLDPATSLPFENLYTTPETLGNDRKALVAAAVKQFPDQDVLVIDAGTCLTYDFKNNRNQYLGGAISPGLKMRYDALHTFTARLPLVERPKEFQLVGDSTENAINSGVIFGALKEMEGIIAEYQARYEDLTVIFTGGDAHFLSIRLKNGIFANSNFLLEGLNYILEFNIIQ